MHKLGSQVEQAAPTVAAVERQVQHPTYLTPSVPELSFEYGSDGQGIVMKKDLQESRNYSTQVLQTSFICALGGFLFVLTS
jgi:hypothetical protein